MSDPSMAYEKEWVKPGYTDTGAVVRAVFKPSIADCCHSVHGQVHSFSVYNSMVQPNQHNFAQSMHNTQSYLEKSRHPWN